MLFSIKENESKYILEYYLDYNFNLDDDVEIIFTQLNNTENKFYEMLLKDINNFLEKVFKKEPVSKILFDY